MDAEIRPVSADEVETFIRVASAAFHGNPSPEQVEEARVELPEPGRAVGAFVGGRLVATAGDFALELTLPGGGLVPISGLSWVGVLAPHRRQGLLRAMMRHHLDRAHEREEVLGGLTASEGGIYGRFGYGVTSFSTDWELDRQRGGLPRRPEAAGGRVELVDEEGAGRAIPAIQDRPGGPWWGT